MAIEKKLIHFGKLADFETQLTAGNILDRSIVFIQDAKKIWTHGTYYDCNNVIPDWNAGEGEEGYIKNRTHFRIKGELIATLDAGDGGTVVLNGALPFLIENTSLLEDQLDFREVIVSKLDTEFEIPSIGPSIKAKITHDGTNYIYEQLTTYGVSNILNFYQSRVTPLQDWAIPDTIVRNTDLATINGQSLTEGGDLTVEGSAKVYTWNWDGEHESVTLSQEEYDNIVEADIVAVNVGGIMSCIVSNKSSKEFGEDFGQYVLIGEFEFQGSKTLLSISIDVSTKLATITTKQKEIPTKTSQLENDSDFVSSDGLKTINGESIVGSGDIAIDQPFITDFTVIDLLTLAAQEGAIQARLDMLSDALSAHKVILVPYDANEGLQGYAVANGYMEDLIYLNVAFPDGWVYLQLAHNRNEILSSMVTLRNWSNKQDKLVSGTNIKNVHTSNGDDSILGSGDLYLASVFPGTSKIVATGIWNDYDVVNISTGGLEFIPESEGPDNPRWSIHRNGDGTKFLSDDGTYKTASGSSGAIDTSDCVKVVIGAIPHMPNADGEVDLSADFAGQINMNGHAYLPSNKGIIDLGYVNKRLATLTSSSISLSPNIYYRHTNTSLSTLTITLGSVSNSNIINEYFVEFTTSSSGTTISLPNTIKWANGETPTFEASTTYQISIVNNLGVVTKFK